MIWNQIQAKFDAWMKSKQALEVKMSKVYVFQWEQRIKGMQNKYESWSDFKGKEIPLNYLMLSKIMLIYTKSINMKCFNIADSMTTLIKGKSAGMTVNDELWFTFVVQLIEQSTGMEWLDTIVSWNKEDQQFIALIYHENAVRSSFGSFIEGLQTQQSLGKAWCHYNCRRNQCLEQGSIIKPESL